MGAPIYDGGEILKLSRADHHVNDAPIASIDTDHCGTREESIVRGFISNQLKWGMHFFVANRENNRRSSNERDRDFEPKSESTCVLPSRESRSQHTNDRRNRQQRPQCARASERGHPYCDTVMTSGATKPSINAPESAVRQHPRPEAIRSPAMLRPSVACSPTMTRRAWPPLIP